MPKASRSATAVIFSIVVHTVVLVVLARHGGLDLRGPLEPAGPPEPIIPILLMPRVPPPAPASPQAAAPKTVELHRRPQRELPPDSLLVAPLVTPAVDAPPPPPPAAAVEEPKGPVLLPKAAVPALAALRNGRLGCANPDAYNLSRAERERCNDALGAGLKDVRMAPLAIGAAKQADLDKAAAAAAADRRYREGSMPSGSAGGTSDQPWKVKP